MNATILCVGKLKEKFYLEACREYEKRLGTLCRMEILQLEEKVSGRQVVSCYDTRTGELLYRRTLGLGDDQQEPLEDW